MEFVFNCSECGQALTGDTEYVGQEVECVHCGAEITVPAPEDAGEEAAEEVAEEAAASPDAAQGKRKFSLRSNAGVGAQPAAAEETAVEADAEAEEAAADADAAEADADAAEAEGEVKPPKKKSPLRIGVEVAAGLIILFVMYKFGVGPLIFAAMNKSAHVVVMNPTEQSYKLKLGWRQLSMELAPRAVATFKVDVGMSEKQGLSVTPLEGGDKRKVKVPLKPGRLVIVNLDGGYTFHAYDSAKAKDMKVDAARLKELQEQIATMEDPVAARQISARMREIGKASVVESITDEVIIADDYRTQGFGTGYQQPTEEDETLPVLSHVPFRLRFGNGELTYDGKNPEQVEGQVQLPGEFKVTVVPAAAETTPPLPEVVVSFGKNVGVRIAEKDSRVSLSVQAAQQDVVVQDKAFDGRWNYNATLADQPGWRWSFQGTGPVEKEETVGEGDEQRTVRVRSRLDASVARGQKPTAKVTQHKTSY